MILIIGGCGFVGSAFVRACERQRREYRVVQRENYGEFIGAECDILINADGNSSKVSAGQEPLGDFDASVRTVRASLIDFRARCYALLSSCDVYPDVSRPEVTKEDHEPRLERLSVYGFHKYLAEQCVRQAAKEWLITRLGGMVGPGLKKNAIFDILAGGPLWLDPDSELQYMSTDDVARITLGLLDLGVRGEVVNICGRGFVRLRDVVEMAGRDVPVKPGSPRVRYEVSVEKLGRWVRVPETRPAVVHFVRAHRGGIA